MILACLLFTTMLAVTSNAQPVVKIGAEWSHSLFLKSDGSLWGMGQGNSGELGDIFQNTNRPTLIVPDNVMAIAAGNSFTLFLKSDGNLWAMGANQNGQLGNGTYSWVTNAYVVSSNVTAVAAGNSFSLFLKNDGSLWGMGDDALGELGNGTNTVADFGYGISVPEQIVSSNVTAIAAGSDFSLFLKSDGSLWAMGRDQFGQLGNGMDGFTTFTNLPEQIVSSNVTAIAAGDYHSLFLKNDGSLWAMGGNNNGQLGNGTYNNTNVPEQIVTSNVTTIAAGAYHSLFIKNDGSLWAMGDNLFGALGDGTTDNGAYKTNLPEEIVASNVTAIAGGQYHSLFLKSDGSLWAMGNNSYGYLGDGTYNSTNRPEQIVVNPGYNKTSIQLLSSGDVRLCFTGIAGANYAVEHTFSLSPPDWTPIKTNPAGSFGILVFTNSPNTTTNNFWRIRFVP